MLLKCWLYLLSNSLSFSVSSLLESANCRMKTKVRMIAMFTSIAFSLERTVESIATPCSEKANGRYFGNLPIPAYKVLFLHLRDSHSTLDNSNMKSGGNLRILALTDLFRYLVSVS